MIEDKMSFNAKINNIKSLSKEVNGNFDYIFYAYSLYACDLLEREKFLKVTEPRVKDLKSYLENLMEELNSL